MRYSISIFALAAPLATFAAPLGLYGKRAASANDILVFQFADVLEQFESSFYSAGLSQFADTDFQDAGFTSTQATIQLLTTIQSDESTHDSVLQTDLLSFGAQPVTSCTFNFDSALTDVATMAATARIVENLGVGAYLGGATLLDDPVLLDSAASILTVEARHQTLLNILSGTGSAVPQAFDIPLTPSDVLAIAGPFISGCDLGIPANTPLTITNNGTVTIGTALTFSADSINGTISEDSLFCQMMLGGNPISISLPFSQCVVPAGVNGPVAIWITSDADPLINNVRDRATNKQIAGPAMAFIDTLPDTLSEIVRTTSNSSTTASADESSTTTTISQEQASSLIAGASTTSDAASSSATDTSTSTASADSSAASAVDSSSNSTAADSTLNMTTGPSADGSITVNGWKELPQ